MSPSNFLVDSLQYEGSIKQCLADPERHHCAFRSDSRLQGTSFDIVIRQTSATQMTKTIWVRLAGARQDVRPRSASPDRRRPTGDEAAKGRRDNLPKIPAEVLLYAVPRFSKRNELIWWPRVKPQMMRWDNIVDRCMFETGRKPVPLATIGLGRGVPEKDVSLYW